MLGLALTAAVLAPHRAESVSWSLQAAVSRVEGAVPAGVGPGDTVTVAWTYDPSAVVSVDMQSCEGARSYGFEPPGGTLRVTIGALSRSYALWLALVADDAACDHCDDTRADAVQLHSGEYAQPGAFLLIVDCFIPFDLLSSADAPRVPGDLNLHAVTRIRGEVWDWDWTISFEHDDVSAVAGSTWTNVKHLYR
jgi:hypothetical protein